MLSVPFIPFMDYRALLNGDVVVVRFSEDKRDGWSCVERLNGTVTLVPTTSLRPYEEEVAVQLPRSVAEHPGSQSAALLIAEACRKALGKSDVVRAGKTESSPESPTFGIGDWVRSEQSAEEFKVSLIELSPQGTKITFDRVRHRDTTGEGVPARSIANQLWQNKENPPWVFAKVPEVRTCACGGVPLDGFFSGGSPTEIENMLRCEGIVVSEFNGSSMTHHLGRRCKEGRL